MQVKPINEDFLNGYQLAMMLIDKYAHSPELIIEIAKDIDKGNRLTGHNKTPLALLCSGGEGTLKNIHDIMQEKLEFMEKGL